MKKSLRFNLILTAVLFLLFVVFTVTVKTVDVAPLGPNDSEIGYSMINTAVHNTLGVSDLWYTISDVMGIFVLGIVAFFAVLGLVQWIQRKHLLKVDSTILLLGVFFVLVAAFYVLFEIVVINYRPILVEGVLEASYPSSHTMLVCCVMGSSAIAIAQLFANRKIKLCYGIFASLVIALTVAGRLLSGVHWLTDIIGGVLLSAALVMLYLSALQWVKTKETK